MVCLDTHVIIWGIKEEASPGQENMVQRAKSYIKHQVSQGVDLMIPAPVVAEALIRGEVDHLRTIRTIIEKSFFIAAFDSPAPRETGDNPPSSSPAHHCHHPQKQ